MRPHYRCLLTATAMSLLLLAACHDEALAGKPLPPPPPPPPVKYQVVVVGQNVGLQAINKWGTVVGEMGGRAKIFHHVDQLAVTPEDLVQDLTDLVQASDPATPWTLLDFGDEINDAGQIAGRGFLPIAGASAARLFRFTPATSSPVIVEVVSSNTGGSHYVQGLNNSGDVLIHRSEDGQSNYPATADATDSAWVFTGLPGQGASRLILPSAMPGAMNDWGQVTGQLNTGSSSAAFLYFGPDPEDYVTFGTLTGSPTTAYNISHGFAINNVGDIAGWARVGGSNASFQAVLRPFGAPAWNDMAIAYSGQGDVADINNLGIPVGMSGGIRALGFVYLNGTAYSLKDLMINPLANIHWVAPTDINDSGVICASIRVSTGKVKGLNQWADYGAILVPVPQ